MRGDNRTRLERCYLGQRGLGHYLVRRSRGEIDIFGPDTALYISENLVEAVVDEVGLEGVNGVGRRAVGLVGGDREGGRKDGRRIGEN